MVEPPLLLLALPAVPVGLLFADLPYRWVEGRSSTTTRAPGYEPWHALAILGAISWAAWQVLGAPGEWSVGRPAAVVWLGVLVGLDGWLLLGWSKASLGRWFQPRADLKLDQPLVATGPYRFVRHPMYLGAIELLLGAAIVLGSGVGLVVWCLVVVMVNRFTRAEEAMLATGLGAPWTTYRREVPARLLPWPAGAWLRRRARPPAS